MMSAITRAIEAAMKLEYTTDTLEHLAELDPRIAEVADDREFLKMLDSIVFCCVSCGWWKRQRENATPDAAEWKCVECLD
jgi:hypothetical protein